MKNLKYQVICFGEVLWDNLPAGKKPGGAPMNVAYHLKKLGVSSGLISRVGNDRDGANLLEVITGLGLSTELCQIDDLHKTSLVEVVVGADHEVKYDIVFPVAWDFIEYDPRIENILKDTEVFVFGSLVTRNEVSRKTLNLILDLVPYKVFDVNLREPHYDKAHIESLLHKTDLLKLNVHELYLLADWFGNAPDDEAEKVNGLQERFTIREVIVTRGSKGASYYSTEILFHYPAYAVEVQDTIGSGDSFLAAFLSKKISGEYLEGTLDFAAAVGAFITSQAGACPQYTHYDLDRFIWENQLNKLKKGLQSQY
jgi:fructokinase